MSDVSSLLFPGKNGEAVRIYDGRRSLGAPGKDDAPPVRPTGAEPAEPGSAISSGGGKGEIHYVRDSDDELPDSDEDPDDDLDI